MGYLVLIKNKNILITGTSKGIGNFLAKKFLKTGNKVWGCSRKKNNIKHKNYFHKKLDLNNEKKIIKWVKEIYKNNNFKIDILINNAAIYEKNLNFFNNFKNIISTYKINLIAPTLLTNVISKQMLKNRNGLIIFISSVASILQEPGTSLYASSKSALESYAKIIKRELLKFNVKVCVFRIQYIKTTLSKIINQKKISKLKQTFASNKINTKEKLYREIIKIFMLKNPPAIISDRKK